MTGHPVVLVVEDEAIIRIHAADIIESAGFKVIEASNADEALRILESRSDIRVIYTDVDMPGGSINGLKLAAAVRDRWPPVDIIVTSGHFAVRQSEIPERGLFFSKPVEEHLLLGALQRFVG